MLNNLLKRCMPWMDKGRWYHIRIDGELVNGNISITNVKYDKSLFSHHDIYNGTAYVYFSDPKINASIIDSKILIYNNDPGLTFSITLSEMFNIGTDDSGPYIEMGAHPGVIDMWLFIRRNK